MKTIYRTIYITLAALIAFSCAKEPSGPDAQGQRERVKFTLQLPPSDGGVTRSLAHESYETIVGDITVLVFEPGTGEFLEAIPGENIAADYSSFEVSLMKGTFDLVLLANSVDIISAVYPSGIPDNTDRSTITQALTLDLPGKWIADPLAAGFRNFPMYAHKDNVQIDDATSLTGKPFQLSQLLAKINLKLSPEASQNLELQAIYVCHRNTKGQLIPTPANWDQTGSSPVAKIPSIPAVAGINQKWGLTYTAAASETGIDGSTNNIYILEAAKGVRSEHPAYFCLIIKGLYKPDNTIGYYRLDFIEEGTTNYLAILRNHAYMVTIEHVLSSGQDTEEDAYHSVTADIVYNVQGWETYKTDHSLYDDLRLDVSTVKVAINERNMARVYFWTNQKQEDVKVEVTAGDENVFYDLIGDGASNFHYDETTGTGYIDIMTEHSKATAKTYEVYINSAGLRRKIEVDVSFAGVRLNSSSYGNYTGAFWRAGQKGERVIAMPYTQAWTARVEYPSEDGAPTGWAVLAPGKSLDPKLWSDDPGDPESFPVEGDLEELSGTGNIYFRIGCKSYNTSTANRYARVVVTTGSTARYIYLRQGEQDDFLMRAGTMDPGHDFNDRPLAMPLTPYNLTSKEFLDPSSGKTGGPTVASHSQIGGSGVLPDEEMTNAAFTEYPSQAGALFQWAQNVQGYQRIGWHPTNETVITDWPSAQTLELWIDAAPKNDACPKGYRRPTDGSNKQVVSSPSPSTSEIRQSLWLDPDQGAYSSITNSIWGYLADGFFDRRYIGPSITAENYSTVLANDTRVAYWGRLFFNPYNYASIFFPAAGYRYSKDGKLYVTGKNAYYWLGTSYTGLDYTYRLNFEKTYAQSGATDQRNAYPIRCIKE